MLQHSLILVSQSYPQPSAQGSHGSPTVNSSIGNIEAKTVAWCTKLGHSTHIMPL